jgi:hypothetical protein
MKMEVEMRLSMMLITMCAMSLPWLALGQTTATMTDYQARIQIAAQETQAQIATLETQVAGSKTIDREALEQRIVEVKKQGEITRLTILLEWAQSSGNSAKVEEIQRALDQWTNPPQPKDLPIIPKSLDKTPQSLTPAATPEK